MYFVTAICIDIVGNLM